MIRAAVIDDDSLIDDALAAWAPAIGSARAAYRGRLPRLQRALGFAAISSPKICAFLGMNVTDIGSDETNC